MPADPKSTAPQDITDATLDGAVGGALIHEIGHVTARPTDESAGSYFDGRLLTARDLGVDQG